MTKIHRFICNYLQENSYVVSSGTKCIIIDPGFQGEEELGALYSFLEKEKLTPAALLLTHGHFDHILAVKTLKERFGIPVYMSPADAPVLEIAAHYGFALQAPEIDSDFEFTPVADEQKLSFGPLDFKVISTPGHTPGCVCYYDEEDNIVFTGDTLFAGAIGRTDLQYGDYDSEIRSIMEKLIFLPGETDIFPGHGPTSTIARERRENPFLEPFNEREEIFSEEEN